MPAVTVNDLNNAQLDVNTIASVATSTAATVTDRLGNTKHTLSGMNAAVLASAAAVQGSIGYLPPVVYAAGISLTLAAQTVGYSGQTYAPLLSALPFTTSGTFETVNFRLIQGISASDLAEALRFDPIGNGVFRPTYASKLGETISVFDFMTASEIASVVGWGSVDVTVPVQSAINYWISQGALGHTVCLRFPYGKYPVSIITVSNPAYTLSIDIDGAEFVGTATSIKYGIFDVIDANVLNVTGSHVLNGGNSANYAALWSLRSVAGGGLARVNIYNPTIRATQVGFWIGDSAIGLKCSEINVFGANFSQCPIPVYLGGSQTGAQFHGCNIVSESNPAFPTSPQRAIWMEGGFIKVSGGSIVANPTANQTLFLNPSNDSYGNAYPGLSICGTHIESNSGVLATISNPRGLATPISNTSSLIINGCAGYSGGGGAVGDFVSVTDGTYAGTIDIRSNNFYASAARSSANMSSTSALTKFVTDKTSFGKNFLNWLGGINGGKVIHDLLPCANATGLGAQVIAAGGSGILKFRALNVVGDLSKYGGGYSPTTGLYTVPEGGFEFLNVSVGLQWSGCVNAFFGLRKNGTFVAYGHVDQGGAGGGLQATLYKLVASDTLDVFFYAYSVAATFDNAVTQTLHMQAATSP